MWTSTTRRKYSRRSQRYETDLTDAEWAVLAPLLPGDPVCGRPHKWGIREAEEAGERMKTAPLYVHGGYDEDGDVIPIENIEPFDDFEDAIQRLLANETAVSILVAQERMTIHGRRLEPVVAVLEARVYPEADPDLWGPDTD